MDTAYVDEILVRTKEVCRAKLRNKNFNGMENDDVVQEASIKVLNAIKKYDPSKSKIQTFLNKVIDRMIIDCFKKVSAQKNLVVSTAARVSDDFAYKKLDQAVIAYTDPGYENVEFWIDFCNNLSFDDRERKIFMLRLYGFKFNEMPSMVGCTEARICQLWAGMRLKYRRL